MNLVASGESAPLAARLSSAFNNVLVTFYILWFIELFSPTFIAPMLICLANSRLAVRRIVEEGLPSLQSGHVTTKYHWKGLQADNNIGESWRNFV